MATKKQAKWKFFSKPDERLIDHHFFHNSSYNQLMAENECSLCFSHNHFSTMLMAKLFASYFFLFFFQLLLMSYLMNYKTSTVDHSHFFFSSSLLVSTVPFDEFMLFLFLFLCGMVFFKFVLWLFRAISAPKSIVYLSLSIQILCVGCFSRAIFILFSFVWNECFDLILFVRTTIDTDTGSSSTERAYISTHTDGTHTYIHGCI